MIIDSHRLCNFNCVYVNKKIIWFMVYISSKCEWIFSGSIQEQHFLFENLLKPSLVFLVSLFFSKFLQLIKCGIKGLVSIFKIKKLCFLLRKYLILKFLNFLIMIFVLNAPWKCSIISFWVLQIPLIKTCVSSLFFQRNFIIRLGMNEFFFDFSLFSR